MSSPGRSDEVVAALAEDSGARCLAGGQTLVAMMNAGLIAPSLVVGLRRVAELKVIEVDEDRGAGHRRHGDARSTRA